MKLTSLTTISPIDGRYGKQLNKIRNIFSEFGLLKFRVQIEIHWLKTLATCNLFKEITSLNLINSNFLDKIIINFNLNDAKRIKKIEKKINHDVKAVEYFLKEKLNNFPELKNFVHFACSSEDINNLSYALMLLTTRKKILLPTWKKITQKIKILSKKYCKIPLLTRTHGQPATPSTIGKELANIYYRLYRQYKQMENIEILGKLNGTIGNYKAHVIAYPEINWIKMNKKCVKALGINWNPYTTQIEPHDYMAEYFDCISRFNTIMIDFNRDIWGYIALDYFKQKFNKFEVGSSIMPHKINPIEFEKSEGNLGLANAILKHFSNKLPISRWQRDLTDSTVLRNIGISIGYSLIAYQATLLGLNKIDINKKKLLLALDNSWEILAEPIQTVMKKYKITQSYEILKKLTRGHTVNKNIIRNFIETLPLPEKEKEKLKKLTPSNYIGQSILLVNNLK